jgi:CubicO group peptidase (beta-lactamase class C family)
MIRTHRPTLSFYFASQLLQRKQKLRRFPSALLRKVGMSTVILAKIDPALEELIEKKKLAGGSVLILREGQIVYQKQFGLRQPGR